MSVKKILKYLYTNFGRKFANQAFKEYLTKDNIKWESNTLYTLQQNEKREYLNYTLMFSVWSILAIMHISKTL